MYYFPQVTYDKIKVYNFILEVDNNADSLFKNTTDKINIGTILFEIPSERENLSDR